MTEVLINNFEYMMKARERIILGLFAGCFALFVSYVYFVERSIVNTVALRSVQSQISAENASLGSLSSEYLALSGGITLDAALAAGYGQAPVSVFVSVPAPAASAAAVPGGSALSMRNAF